MAKEGLKGNRLIGDDGMPFWEIQLDLSHKIYSIHCHLFRSIYRRL